MIPGYSKRKQVSTERVMARGVIGNIAPKKKIFGIIFAESKKMEGNSTPQVTLQRGVANNM